MPRPAIAPRSIGRTDQIIKGSRSRTSDGIPANDRLARTLGWPHLVALGVGAIVGTGILTLIGVGADKAGPAVLIAFLIAGLVCTCAALAYAEMATMIPATGGAYAFARTVFGDFTAWAIGWCLLLEYCLVVGAVAVGWSGYAAPLLHQWLGFPLILMAGPTEGGVINLPAIFIITVVTMLLLLGMRRSALVSAALVILKIAALGLFVWAALPAFDLSNLTPFSPYGFGKTVSAGGTERGIMAAAAIIFSAFYGFDAVASAAEETRNPRRDLAIGILGSMLACIVIYVVIAVAALGAVPFASFANSPEPLALILRELDQSSAAHFLAISAVIALPTVILAFFYGHTRVVFAMARDGLLPRRLAKVSRAGVPVRTTLVTTLLVSTVAAFLPLGEIVALANAGTLLAFSTVALGMLVMRLRAPFARRGYRAPAAWLVGPVAIAGCFYLFASLPSITQIWFLGWNGAVALAYFLIRRGERR